MNTTAEREQRTLSDIGCQLDNVRRTINAMRQPPQYDCLDELQCAVDKLNGGTGWGGLLGVMQALNRLEKKEKEETKKC